MADILGPPLGGVKTPPANPIADALERHNTLGARCTCGATLPLDRLDTPRWFAEHLADVVRLVGGAA